MPAQDVNPPSKTATGIGQTSSETRPLLTIAVPTYNRASQLATLLSVLESQLAQFPQVSLLVSDNASQDDTPEVVATAQARFAALTGRPHSFVYHRHPENIGSDANFAACFGLAPGHFFWLCGDDDIIVPGALAQVMQHLQTAAGTPAEVDLLYATSYGFRADFLAEQQGDPFGRRFHTIRDPRTLAAVVNIMFTFISGMIVNKGRLESLPHEDPAAFVGTNLVQLSWSLPLLLAHRKSIVLWERPVAARTGEAGGYSLGEVFGNRLSANLARLLPNRPDLSAPILNFALRRWFPSVIIDLRSSGRDALRLQEAPAALRRAFGRNPRYWIFTWPALKLPLPAAKFFTRCTAALSKLIYIAHMPGFWRKQT